jgi:hypothetical protein
MPPNISRRGFVTTSLLASAGAVSLEEHTLLAEPPPAKNKLLPATRGTMPTGKLGKLELSRLILGGNLISGFAHSRDLMYVSKLLTNYFTPEKILDTLELAEAHGITAVNTNPKASGIIQRYWKERGGKLKWIVQTYPADEHHLDETIKPSIDAGADAVYIQGHNGDKFIEAGKLDVVAKIIDFIKLNGVPAGIAGHSLQVPMACEKAGIPVDFYVKTLHMSNYFTFQHVADEPVGRNDNYWCADPDATIAFMKTVEKPWFAYKVMAAGAIPPEPAFRHAFNNGADFILAGIFDFQIADDVTYAKRVLASVNRTRPWRA